MKKLTAILLFAVLGAGLPLSSGAQIEQNNAGRSAAQKHDEHLSRKEVREHHKALRRARQHSSKAAKHRKNGVPNAS